MKLFLLTITLLLALMAPDSSLAADLHALKTPEFVGKLAEFPRQEAAAGIEGIGAKLAYRAKAEPFLLVATIIFILAILHTFVAVPITKLAHRVQHDHDARIRKEHSGAKAQDMVSFKATMLHFLGEVEAIFGIAVLALKAAML